MVSKLTVRLAAVTFVVIAGGLISAATASRAASQTAPLTSEERRVYRKAHTVIEWTSKEIAENDSLGGLQPAANQDDLPAILQEAGEQVALFVEQFPNCAAKESIDWKVEDPAYPAAYNRQFRFLLAHPTAGGGKEIGESRTEADGSEINYKTSAGANFLTLGFARSELFLDPSKQATSQFRYLGRLKLGNREADVVGFAQVPEKGFVFASYQEGKKSSALFFQGLVWIDTRTHVILRIQTYLLAPPPGKRLVAQDTQIVFGPIQFSGGREVFMLPVLVVVDTWRTTDIEAPVSNSHDASVSVGLEVGGADSRKVDLRTHCHSIHTYSEYK